MSGVPLSYDPAVDGLRRDPAVDDQLLQQSGAAGPLDPFRQALPAWQQRQHILRLVANNQVVVISGETGEALCSSSARCQLQTSLNDENMLTYCLEMYLARGRVFLQHHGPDIELHILGSLSNC